MNRPTPYVELNAVLEDLIANVQNTLGETFVGACLQGSFALGDFDLDSDVDFIVVVGGELSTDQVSMLQAVHRDIYSLGAGWAQHLEGSYFPAPIDESVVTARTTYGEAFAAAAARGRVAGVQFHPEKSQEVGLTILRNFVASV